MSLLEDVFLENEAGEAQELERIIEGDEFDERPRSRSDSDENSAKEDEAEEDKRRVDPTNAKPKRVIKNPRFVLNPARLTGPRGIQVVSEHFKDFKFKGKGHEREDLDLVLKKLEHWAYRLYPKFQFEDCLKKIESLGKKKAVSVHLHRIRTDQITSDETVVQKDSSGDEATPVQAPEEDEFDKLLQQQIEIARATPAPSSIKKTPYSERSSMMPKASSSPSINEEQRERMLRSRRMAEERRLARLKQNNSQNNPAENENDTTNLPTNNISNEKRPNNSANDSSDDEDVINKSVTKTHDSNKSDTKTNDSNKSDTVKLDDGIVVTKSPKCYVPAKRRNKSSFDQSENSNMKGVTNDSNINELDNDGKVVTLKTYVPAKKLNKSRIDSSDDDTLVINEPITVDVDKHHNDSLAKSPKIIANKSDATDSSDDDALVINEPITVDVEKHYNDSLIKSSRTSKYKSNVMDSSNNNDLVLSELVTIDVDKHHNDGLATSSNNIPNKNKHNIIDSSDDEPIGVENHHIDATKHDRSNLIDSSDSEDEAVVMNESITVDIHSSNKYVTNSNKGDSNKSDTAFDSLRAITEKKYVMEDCNIEIQSENIQNKNGSNNEVTKIIENPKVPEVENVNVSETNITKEIELRNEQNVLETENIDLMDVDFGDDF